MMQGSIFDNGPTIIKIVFTGGPCGGKTTSLQYVQQELAERGILSLIVPEAMTQLRLNGFTPDMVSDPTEYDRVKTHLQILNEEAYVQAACAMAGDDGVIVLLLDRGIPDSLAFTSPEQYKQILDSEGLTEISGLDRYDAVFHLVTAADGAIDSYTTENNAARTQDSEGAIRIDRNLIKAYTGHPHFRVFDNSTDFKTKVDRVFREVCNVIGYPEPKECERKFLIEYPDISKLENNPNCRKVNITQTYLISPEGVEKRVRRREMNGGFSYYETTKKPVNDTTRVEVENRITEREYLRALSESDPKRNTIEKIRYCLTENNQYFEINVYPFWKDRAVMEIELSDEHEKINPPKDINIIKEVTNDERYYNYNLAANTDIPLDKLREKVEFQQQENMAFVTNLNGKHKEQNLHRNSR